MQTHWNRGFVVVLLCLAVGLAGSLMAPAVKGGANSPAPPGRIYFRSSAGSWSSMNGDGSNKTPTPISVLGSSPSHYLHEGARWFAYFDIPLDGNVDAAGETQPELFLKDHAGRSFRLTDDPDLLLWWGYYETRAMWGRDDSFVSFTAVKRTDEGFVGGLFVAPIDWSSGVPVAGTPVLTVPTSLTGSWMDSPFPRVYEHEWSPSGDQAAFVDYDDESGAYQIFVATITAQDVTTRWLAAGTDPSWSPDGTRLAFASNGICTIAPDGARLVRLTQSTKTNKESRNHWEPTWSLDGAYIAYTEFTSRSRGTTNAVFRIPSSGGTSVNLTSDVGYGSLPMWRP